MNIFLTGAAGFIGFHTCEMFLKSGAKIWAVDNLNNYYDKGLKVKRLNILKKNKKFFFQNIDISDNNKLSKFIKNKKFDILIHLAAQAGVRYSLEKPREYLKSNLIGFFNILEVAKNKKVKNFLFASTSSVYGNSKQKKFSENIGSNHPIQFYAATKRSNEIMAHSYSYLYGLQVIGLRFFTVYGPWGRPDMSYFKFSENIVKKKPIPIFNKGNHTRDFTYIDDAIKIIKELSKLKLKSKSDVKENNPGSGNCKFEIFNISCGKQIKLLDFVQSLKKSLNINLKMNFIGLQKGDMIHTHSSKNKISKFIKLPKPTPYQVGLQKFVDWYKKYKKL